MTRKSKIILGIVLAGVLTLCLSYIFINRVEAYHTYTELEDYSYGNYDYKVYGLYFSEAGDINHVSGQIEITGWELVSFEIVEASFKIEYLDPDPDDSDWGEAGIYSFSLISNTIYPNSNEQIVYAEVTLRKSKDVLECYFGFTPDLPDKVDTNDVSITKNAVKNVPQVHSVQTYSTDTELEVSSGDTFWYVITITNNSPIATDNVVLTDEIPSEFSINSDYVNLYDECSVDEQTITCDIGSMDVGAEITYNFPVTVLEGSSGSVTNTATVTVDDGNPKYATATVEILYSDIKITKIASVSQIRPGEVFTYTITVRNNGTATSKNLVVYDMLDDDLIYVNSNPEYNEYDDGTYIWDIGSLGPEASTTITIQVRLNSNSTKTSILNTARVCEEGDSNCKSDNNTIPVRDSDIKIEKTASDDEVRVGDTFTYTITVTNEGDAEATNIEVTDELDSQLSLISATVGGAGITVSGNDFSYTISSLGANGGSIDIVLTVQVLDTASSGDTISNKACATESGKDEVCDDADIDVIDSNVTITKTVSNAVVNVGDEFTYIITIENTSDYDSRQITITDDIDSNLEIIEVSDNVEPNGNQVTFNVGILEAHGTRTYTIKVKANSSVDDNTVIPNTATLKEVGKDDKEAKVNVKVVKPNLSVTKTAETNNEYNYVNPGDEFTYQIIVNNSGNGDAKNVIITDEIDSRLTIINSGGGTEDGQVITWTKDIAAGNSVTITVTVRVKDDVENNTRIPNVVVVTYEDKNIDDNDDVFVTDSIITLTKVASVNKVRKGEEFYYTIRITNTGDAAAENLTLTDNLPSELSLIEVDIPTGVSDNSSGSNLSFLIETISPNQTYEIIVYVEVTGDVEEGDKIVNTATLTYDDNELEASDNVIVIDSNITIDKSASKKYVAKGEEYTYTITISNIGSASASNLEVIDTFDEDIEIIDSNGGTVDYTNHTITWNIASLEASSQVSYTIKVRVNSTSKTSVLNKVVVREPDKPDKEDEVEVEIGSPSLSVSKLASVTSTIGGGEFEYYITVRNDSDYDATNIVLTDIFDSQLIIIDNDGGIINGNGITWSFDLSANSSIVFTVKVKVAENIGEGEIANVATITYNEEDILSNEVIVTIGEIINPQTGNIIKYSLIGGGVLVMGGIIIYTKKKGRLFRI